MNGSQKELLNEKKKGRWRGGQKISSADLSSEKGKAQHQEFLLKTN